MSVLPPPAAKITLCKITRVAIVFPNARQTASTVALLIGLLVFPLAVSSSTAEGISRGARHPMALPQSLPRAEDVGPFLDRLIRTQLARHGIPGAAVALVKGSKILHLGGYGRSDLQRGTPVSAESTLFRTGSVSKSFTWTAVLQLVEQGKLDLHADVNRYLTAFRIPATYPDPITLAHLLTHTAGFEDRAFGVYARTPAELAPLGAFVTSQMPARIFPPGEVSAYSNYGACLAGYIVERVSGVPFENYVEAHILAPLGMAGSSFRQPLPREFESRLAKGYRDSLEPGAFELNLAVPAGALSATAADMSGFMIALLQGGRVGGARILDARSARAMQERQFSNHPAVSGLTYGFQELNIGGQRVLAQPGDMLYFTTALFLLPQHDLGLYVAYNRGRATDAPMELLENILGWFFPSPPWVLPAAPAPRSASDPGRFAGGYRITRRNETGLGKLRKLFAPVRVRVAAPGVLHISGLRVVPESLWRETKPGVFRDLSSPEIVAFRTDASGRATHLFEGNFPIAAYTRLPWYGDPELHFALLALCLPFFAVTPLAWTLSALRHSSGGDLSLDWRSRMAAASMCVVNLLFLLGMIGVIANGRELLFGLTPLARTVLFLPPLSAALTILSLVLAGTAWRRNRWRLRSRLYYSLLGLLGLVFIGSLYYWNLLGTRF